MPFKLKRKVTKHNLCLGRQSQSIQVYYLNPGNKGNERNYNQY